MLLLTEVQAMLARASAASGRGGEAARRGLQLACRKAHFMAAWANWELSPEDFAVLAAAVESFVCAAPA